MDRDSRAYLAVCALYRDLAGYLPEWIEFHRLVGVERFFLYDNFSADDHLDVLAPYVEEGVVAITDWPVPVARDEGYKRAFRDCLARYGDEARWIAFLDIDEFLFSPAGRPLPEVLAGYEEYPGVGVNSVMFGTSNHREKLPAPLIERCTLRAPDDQPVNRTIKSIVNPARTLYPETLHDFIYRDGVTVDENKQPVGGDGWHTEKFSASILRINHYWAKSEEELRDKLVRWDNAGRPREWERVQRLNERYNRVPDNSMSQYLPALKAALAS